MITDPRTRAEAAFAIQLISLAKAYKHTVNVRLEHRRMSHTTALVVMHLSRSNGSCIQRHLAGLLDMAPPSLVPILVRMEQEGLVTRTPQPADKRANEVSLTPAGWDLARRTERDLQGIRHDLLAEVSTADLHAALRVFTALDAALSQDPKDPR